MRPVPWSSVVQHRRADRCAVARKKARPAGARQRLFYLLKWTPDQRQFGIEIVKGKFPDSGEEWWNVERALLNPPQFVAEEDLGILRALWADRLHETRLRRDPQNGRFPYADSGGTVRLLQVSPL